MGIFTKHLWRTKRASFFFYSVESSVDTRGKAILLKVGMFSAWDRHSKNFVIRNPWTRLWTCL